MRILRIVIIVLALVEAGWMTFDGSRALMSGDYVTPTTGPHAGQVGPWQYAARAVGIEPRSTLMKCIFLVYGLAWLAVILAFVRGAPWAWTWMLVAAVGTLWYLPIGTVTSALLVVALLWLRARGHR